MQNEIGNTAGSIYDLLNNHSEMTATAIKKELGLKDSSLYMALGWLAREGNLEFGKKGSATTIALKK